MVHACNLSYLGGLERGYQFRVNCGLHNENQSQKNQKLTNLILISILYFLLNILVMLMLHSND